MRLTSVRADRIRSLSGAELAVSDGITAIVGVNGSGKTNLLEALYFSLTGRSFRTGDRRDLIPFGSAYARAVAVVESGSMVRHEFMAAVSRSEPTRLLMDGASVQRSEARDHRPMIEVFSPDRLDLVKGPPSARRAHLDSFISARWPGREGARSGYGRALAQRNALLSRIARGEGSARDLGTWDRSLAAAAEELIRARREAASELGQRFAAGAGELGLTGRVGLSYRSCAEPDVEALEAGFGERRERDLAAGRTTWGPHLDELRLELDGRQLRRYGSQGQQRIGLLALLFAEREALVESGSPVPLMLLDDVMSELDTDHRRMLIERLGRGGQSLITAADGALVPSGSGVEVSAIESLTGADR